MYPTRYTRRADEEFRSGKLDVDLWLEALGEAAGSEAEAERLYLRKRAAQLRERGGGMGLFAAGKLITPSRFLWLYPLLFVVAGLLLTAIALTGTLNPNAVPTGPETRLAMAGLGVLLAGIGAWGLRVAWRAMEQAQNTEL